MIGARQTVREQTAVLTRSKLGQRDFSLAQQASPLPMKRRTAVRADVVNIAPNRS